jgi:hypothetical protein
MELRTVLLVPSICMQVLIHIVDLIHMYTLIIHWFIKI